MKIAVTATEPSLDAPIDPRFGRCRYFLVVELDDMNFEAIENPNSTAGGGAGIQSAKLVADSGATVVLTGNCGPNAFSALEAADVKVIVGMTGTAREAIEAYKSGAVSAAEEANVESHFGTGGKGRGRA